MNTNGVILTDGSTNYGTQTFKLNLTNYTVGGKIDNKESLRQSIALLLNTEADKYIIYPYTYGFRSLDLIGKSPQYVAAVLPERVKTTLLTDDRITDVTDFSFELNKNKLMATCIVHSIYGTFDYEMAVTI